MPVPDIYDMEWEILIRSGNLRQHFNELRAEIQRLQGRVSELEAAARNSRSSQAQSRRPVLTPMREEPVMATAPIPPAPTAVPVEESKKPEDDLDNSAQRFSLLELD